MRIVRIDILGIVARIAASVINLGDRVRVLAEEPDEPCPERAQTTERTPDTVPLKSTTLFGGKDRLLIEHQGQLYTLRKTRNGKLILTK